MSKMARSKVNELCALLTLVSFRCSVQRCPRDDLHRLRLPDDVPEEIRLRKCRFQPAAGSRSASVGDAGRGLLLGEVLSVLRHNCDVSKERRGIVVRTTYS